jgi:hypothetical protein
MAGGITFGTRLFGKVDSVPGKCHVSTVCWHVYYLPLIPRKSYIIIHERHDRLSASFEGIEIGFSWKSWLIAWVRLLLAVPTLLGILATIGLAFAATNEKRTETHWSEVVVVGAIVAIIAGMWIVTYLVPGIGRATRSRRNALLLILENVPMTDHGTTQTHAM